MMQYDDDVEESKVTESKSAMQGASKSKEQAKATPSSTKSAPKEEKKREPR